MSLGVLNNLSAMYAENNLNNTTNSLNTVLQQLSSGSKINSGANDAAGLSLVDGLQANSQALTQSQTNATEGVGLLQVADGALSQVTSLLNRAVTLATEASNGTLNSSQDMAANQEYQSILSEINNIGTTTTYNQEQVFNSNTNIYTGDSSATGASIDSLNIRTLSSSNVGDTSGTMAYSSGQTASNVFVDLSNDGTNAQLSDSLGAAGSSTAMEVTYLQQGADGTTTTASAPITVGFGTQYANTAQGLISAINGAGLGLTATFGTAADAGAGAVAAAEDSNFGGGGASDTGIIISGVGVGVSPTLASGNNVAQGNGVGEIGTMAVGVANDAIAGSLNVVDSSGKSHAITLGTAGSTDTLGNLAATINASGWGITANLSAVLAGVVTNENATPAAATTMVLTSATSKASIAGSGFTDATVADPTMLSNTPTPGAQFDSTVGKLTISAGGAYGDTLAGSMTIGSQKITIGAADDTLASLASTINAGAYGVTANYSQANADIVFTSSNSNMVLTDTTTDTGNAGAANIDAGFNAISAAAPASTNASAYESVGIGFTSSATATAGIVDYSTAVSVGGNETYGGTGSYSTVGANDVKANVGLVSDLSGTNGIATISYADQSGQSLSATDLSNQTDAQTALTSLNKAITDVAAQDGYIGAQINTLNSVSSVLSTQSENVTSAQNAVQATDYASATSNMSKYEILSQTGISALAQANSMQQEVTKLLQ
jgi:flagellin